MLTYLISLLFIVLAFREILFWVFWWQLKEYRLDRMVVHLRDTRQGQKIFFSLEIIGTLLILLLYFIGIFLGKLLVYYSLLVSAFFLYELFITIKKIFFHSVKRPVFTIKSASIVFLSFLTAIVFLMLPLSDFIVWIMFLVLVIPFIVALYVFLFSFPTEIYTDIVIQKAKEKRKSFKKLQVIAISGSYGKSSTKEVIAQLLKKKFSVVNTTFSQNTPLAVAQTFLKGVTPKTDFFIAELGAYKRGEVAQLARMIMPIIGVTTAVSDQHLALYGSMHDVVLSEMELIQEIPKTGFLLFNANSKRTILLAEQTKKRIYWYGLKKRNTAISASNIKATTKGVTFTVLCGKHSFIVSSPLLGIHTIENILPAIFLGLHFGLSEKEIIQSIASLKPPPKTMERKSILPYVTVIDDSFNASPESVRAAVDYLLLFRKKKILVLSPLIELGKKAKERHFEIGALVADIDVLMLTNGNFLPEIIKGVTSRKGKVHIVCDTYVHLSQELRKIVADGDVVIFEGKEAGIVLNQL